MESNQTWLVQLHLLCILNWIGEIEFAPVYFNSKTKTVTNQKFYLKNAFQEILYRIDNCINEGSSWIVELIESQYINISIGHYQEVLT